MVVVVATADFLAVCQTLLESYIACLELWTVWHRTLSQTVQSGKGLSWRRWSMLWVVCVWYFQCLRQFDVSGKFVEFFGRGVSSLSILERTAIANMCPEYGATAAFFPVDSMCLDYLRRSGFYACVCITHSRIVLMAVLQLDRGLDHEERIQHCWWGNRMDIGSVKVLHQ